VAHRLVDRAFGRVAAGDVRERHAVHETGLGRREDLEAVAEHEDDLGSELLNRIAHANHAERDRSRGRGRRIAGDKHVDALVDREAVLLDLVDGMAEFGGEVHAGDNELQRERWVIAQLAQDPIQHTVFGAASGDNADAARHHAQSPSRALLGTLTMRASICSASARSARGHCAYIGNRCISVQSGRAM